MKEGVYNIENLKQERITKNEKLEKTEIEITDKFKMLEDIRSQISKIEVKNMNLRTNKVLSEAGILFSITTDHPVTMLQYLPLCAGIAGRPHRADRAD